VTYPSGARCRRWQRLARWYQSIIGRGSKSGAGILDNRHLEQTAKSLCAQDTTLSRKCILSVSARPRRQMTAGTVMSSHHQVRSRPRAGTLLNLYSEQSAESFCIQDTIFIGHMHPDVEFIVWHDKSCMFACGPVGHTVEKNESSSVVLWSYKNFGICNSWLCWPVSEHRARNHPPHARIVDVWLTHELKSHRIIPFFVECVMIRKKTNSQFLRFYNADKWLCIMLTNIEGGQHGGGGGRLRKFECCWRYWSVDQKFDLFELAIYCV